MMRIAMTVFLCCCMLLLVTMVRMMNTATNIMIWVILTMRRTMMALMVI